MNAASIMTRKVITAHPDDTVAAVARVLADNHISAVPVCDPAGALLGMVSEGDLMRPFLHSNVARRTWWLTLLADGTDLAPEFLDYVRADRHRIGDLMTTDIVTATEETPIGELADLLTRHRIKRLPIVRDGSLVGVVSRADVIRAIAHTPEALAAHA
ncbi:MAG: CBS domain-containing protein [Acetobacteraceae bacterium]